jgi:hypothetical protein
MRRLTTMTAAALTLGASTTWLAVELRAAREELAELRARKTVTAPAASAAPADSRALDTPATTPLTAAPTGQSPPAREALPPHDDVGTRAATLAHNLWVRTWLNDPEKRAQVLADFRKSQAQQLPPGLLEPDDADYDRLLDALAANQLRYTETIYRCNTSAGCDFRIVMAAQQQSERRDLVALLGEQRTQRLENHRDNVMERNGVQSFGSALPESVRLSDAQAEKLVDALGEERRRLVREWELRGDQIGAIANSWGSLHYPQTGDIQQRVADVMEFQRRQRERAVELLTDAQLEIFTRQQEQMLEIVRGSWGP